MSTLASTLPADPMPNAVTDTGSQTRVKALADFAKWAIREGAFTGGDLSGGEVQDKAVSLGLLQSAIYDPAVHGEIEFSEPGMEIFVFTSALDADAGRGEVDRLTRERDEAREGRWVGDAEQRIRDLTADVEEWKRIAKDALSAEAALAQSQEMREALVAARAYVLSAQEGGQSVEDGCVPNFRYLDHVAKTLALVDAALASPAPSDAAEAPVPYFDWSDQAT